MRTFILFVILMWSDRLDISLRVFSRGAKLDERNRQQLLSSSPQPSSLLSLALSVFSFSDCAATWMEDHIARFLSSPTCPDTNASTGSLSVGNAASLGDSFHAESAEPYGVDCMLVSGHLIGTISDFQASESGRVKFDGGMVSQEELCYDASLLHWQTRVYGGSAVPDQVIVGSNPSVESFPLLDVYGQLVLAHASPSSPARSSPGYTDVYPLIDQPKMQVYGAQEEEGGFVKIDEKPLAIQGCYEAQALKVPTFVASKRMNSSGALDSGKKDQRECYSSGTVTDIPLKDSDQISPSEARNAAKPRARARRGQATDPHSIAERLRREKISERMKNLQELVPQSNKADKASMLDEIIDYVKFLQLQVKVLSMSRLGGAGTVIPLLAETPAEGLGGFSDSSPAEVGGHDATESPDMMAFEEEVMRLLETDIGAAMQFLQAKGLCLLPVELASAVSERKGSWIAAIPPGKMDGDHDARWPEPYQSGLWDDLVARQSQGPGIL